MGKAIVYAIAAARVSTVDDYHYQLSTMLKEGIGQLFLIVSLESNLKLWEKEHIFTFRGFRGQLCTTSDPDHEMYPSLLAAKTCRMSTLRCVFSSGQFLPHSPTFTAL